MTYPLRLVERARNSRKYVGSRSSLFPVLFLVWTHVGRVRIAAAPRQIHSTPKGWELREALERLDKDLYDKAPGPDRPYISSLKNPCWVTSAAAAGGDDDAALARSTDAGAVQCLPYGMVLGGFQCGAASLFLALYKHPLVLKTDVSRWHFWAEFDKRMDGYLAGMEGAAAKIAAWRARLRPRLLEAAAAEGGGGGGGAGGGTASNGTAHSGASHAAGVAAAWLAGQQPVLLDGSSSTFAFYWSPGMRAHRAFMAAMGPCWTDCHAKHKKAGPGREECLEAGCYPAAREADRKIAASLGLPYADVSLPLLMSAVYGGRPPKMVVLLRNPVDRLYSAYWRYGHYQDKYGRSAEGFASYVREQLSVLRSCMSRNASTTPGLLDGGDMGLSCLLHLESWGLPEERLFFHADQILRGVYVIYLERWLRFFDRRQLLVLRSEDYFAHPVRTYYAVLRFLDLDPEAVTHHDRVRRIERLLTERQAVAGKGKGKGTGATTAGSGSTKALRAALEAPGDDRLWDEVRRLLTQDKEGRYAANRAAARAMSGEDPGVEAAGAAAGAGTTGSQQGPHAHAPRRSRGRRRLQATAGSGPDGADGGRPPMPEDVRRELAAFYEPYNRRLAALLGDPAFIRGWG